MRPYYERLPRTRASRTDIAGALALARLHRAIRELRGTTPAERLTLIEAANADGSGAPDAATAAGKAASMLRLLRDEGAPDA